MKGHARNLMTEHVLALRPEMSLAEIARVLVAAHHGGAPVVDEHQRVIGFISEVDLLDAFLAQRTNTATARDIMSHPVLVADEFMPVDEVMSLLRESGIHHLPVVRQERLVGIITPHDVLEHVVENILPIPAEDA
jgi:CBS domain-containing protein